MVRVKAGTTALAWLGALLCVVAVAGTVVVAVGTLRTLSYPDVNLSDGPRDVLLPADARYGIYFDDADNSGYTADCEATDAYGAQVMLEDPPGHISFSDTETLDFVFDTGQGELTIDCSVSRLEGVRVGPVTDWSKAILSVVVAGVLGLGGILMITSRIYRDDSEDVSPSPLAGLPPATTRPDWLPLILAAAVGGGLAAHGLLQWITQSFTMQRAFNDPDFWGGERVGPSRSLLDVLRSTWSDVVPELGVVALVLATWLMCVRGFRRTAWVTAAAAMAIGVLVALLLV